MNSVFNKKRVFSLRSHFSGSPVFKRDLVRLKNRQSVLSKAREIIQLIESSRKKKIQSIPGQFEFVRYGIYRFSFEGVPVIIKFTFDSKHGLDFVSLRRDFLTHQKAVRSGNIVANTYVLRSPKIYGRLDKIFDYEGSALVMENIREVKVGIENKPGFLIALAELRKNLEHLEYSGKLVFHKAPQWTHVMTTGQENGKWVFYLPYDYA